MKWTVILVGLLSASLVAIAQDPTGIAPAQTNRANQPVVFPDASRPQQLNPTNQAVFPDTSRPQQLNPTNQTNWGSSTNTPSPATNSTSGTGSSSSSHITIIKGSDTSTSERHLPPNGEGVEVVTNTTGTANDWRSGGSTPHLVPPRQPVINP